jgi:DNA end-binding protein Ku
VAPRASWKGFLKIGELTCPVALHTAASTAERIRFHTINRATGHRVQRQFVDQETGKVVQSDDQVKGYEVSKGEYVVLEPEEISAAIPQGDKTLSVDAFVKFEDIDKAYFDRPYYLTPADEVSLKAYGLIREGLKKEGVAALARALLFRKVRTVLIRPFELGLMATTLNFDYEVREADTVFDDIKDVKIAKEMLDLAEHIISTKRGRFDPAAFDDRYEAALAELVKAKMEGRPMERPAEPEPTNVVSLMDALRQSAGAGAKAPAKKKAASSKAERGAGKKAPARKAASKRAAAAEPRRRKAS